jgi:hypothetical protein
LRVALRSLVALAISLLFAVPAYAAAATTILPEPGTLTLLGLGVAGVAIGRRFSRKPPQE